MTAIADNLAEAPLRARSRTLRRNLAWLVIAVVGLAVIPIAGVAAWQNGEREVALETVRLDAAARVVASLAVEGAAQNSPQEAFRALRAIAQVSGVEYGRIEAFDGKMLAETGAGARLTSDVRANGSDTIAFLQQLLSGSSEVDVPILHDGNDVGRVVLLGRTEGMVSRFLVTLGESMAVAFGAILVGLLIAWRLQERIARPILALSRVVRDVQETYDFRQSVKIPAEGEIGDLVSGFNQMLREIHVRDDRIAAQMAGLEDEVQTRTAELVVAKEAAEAANTAKSDFLATMSHEIRTPMNGVMVMAEMLAAGELAPRERRFAEVIAKSGASLLAIINDILDFSKMEAGKLELETVPVDLSEIVDDVLSLFWERAASSGLDLAGYVDPSLPQSIAADPVRLRQVLCNLVNNAIKFTTTGGVLVEIFRAPGNRIEIAVNDTGIGIPEDKLGSVFGAFTQADQSTTRRFGGTGLGLAICERIVQAMGGEWRIASELGKGSRFAFAFATETLASAAEWPRAPVADLMVSVACAGALTQRTLRAYLKDAGYSVAEHGRALAIGDPAGLNALEGAPGAAICIAANGNPEPHMLLHSGRVGAVLALPISRSDLGRLLHRFARGEPLTDSAETAAEAAISGAIPSFSGSRVLVADDNAVNREVAIEALHRLGIEVKVVTDGREAIEAVRGDAYDAVLMDASMPGMTGFDAAREIRRLERESGTDRVPIIALTAHVLGAAAEAWRDAEMDGVLHKPFTLNALAAVLGKFLVVREAPDAYKPTPQTESTASDLSDFGQINRRVDLFDTDTIAQLQTFAGNGRADFVAKVFRLYIENAPQCMERILAAAQGSDPDAVSEASHALKSMSFNIGARAVATAAGNIEAKCVGGEALPPDVAASLGGLVDSTIATLQSAL